MERDHQGRLRTLGTGAKQWGKPRRHLLGHEANPLLARLGALIITGPTRTNVMDVAIAVIGTQVD